MMTSSNGNIFRVSGHLCGEFIHDRWIPCTKNSGALMFSLICSRINGWVNNREAGDLRWHRANNDVTDLHRLYLETPWNRNFICPVNCVRLSQLQSLRIKLEFMICHMYHVTTIKYYSETTWAVGIAQLTHHEVQGGGQKSRDRSWRDFCPHREPSGELIAQYRPPMSFCFYPILYLGNHL